MKVTAVREIIKVTLELSKEEAHIIEGLASGVNVEYVHGYTGLTKDVVKWFAHDLRNKLVEVR